MNTKDTNSDLYSHRIQDHLPLFDDCGSSVFRQQDLLDVWSYGRGAEGEDSIVLQTLVCEITFVGVGSVQSHHHWHQVLHLPLCWKGQKQRDCYVLFIISNGIVVWEGKKQRGCYVLFTISSGTVVWEGKKQWDYVSSSLCSNSFVKLECKKYNFLCNVISYAIRFPIK